MRPRTIQSGALAVLPFLLAACVASAAPQAGYVYPAGGRRGTTFVAEVGGQALRSVDGVRVSGTGVRGEIVEYAPALNNQELGDVGRFLRSLVMRRWCLRAMAEADKPAEKPPLPDHPWLRDLDNVGPYEIGQLRQRLFDSKIQPNAQLAEKVVVRFAIAADAAPGDRELRLLSPTGLSNPIRFQIGTLPEMREKQFAGGPQARVVVPPAVLNGQIMPGETDRIRIEARKGQKLVVQVQARRLIPYLADAVPGWFQAVASLHAADGRELAWCDDFRFDPDPVLFCEIPADGTYELRVRDAIYRGREDFLYRIAVAELPYATQLFPLGARAGSVAKATVRGWDLPPAERVLDTAPDGPGMRRIAVANGLDHGLEYLVDSFPDVAEKEPNDEWIRTQAVPFPAAVNGRIERPGDVDVFRFAGHKGQEVVAEIWARRLGSPLDSFVRILDAEGQEIAANDDHKRPEMGLLTHHADSFVQATLPRDGQYLIEVADIQRQGGSAHSYRLQVRPPQPDFALRLVPSAIRAFGGRSATVAVHVLRREGFAGEIELVLVDAPDGFRLSNTRIAADKDTGAVRILVPKGLGRQVLSLRLAGRAIIGETQVERPAVPAEDMMQAFLWRFLVPQREFLVAIDGPRPIPTAWHPLVAGVSLATPAPLRIPLGGTARIVLRAPATLPGPPNTPLDTVRFHLASRPRGLALCASEATADGIVLTIGVDRNMALPGDASHLILEATAPGADPRDNAARLSLGVLPAIPFEIVKD